MGTIKYWNLTVSLVYVIKPIMLKDYATYSYMSTISYSYIKLGFLLKLVTQSLSDLSSKVKLTILEGQKFYMW